MCGIAGFIGDIKNFPTNLQIKKCINLMKRRGPDFQSYKIINDKLKFLLCASRLSIIDLNARSNQPFEDENGILIFNGEIYNYLEIRKDLKKRGVKFKTQSDTEVLLKFLNLEGEEKIYQLDGMWAFAYYSKKKKITILSRDKFGEKPVYYNLNKKNNFLIFGSNVNYIKKLTKTKIKVDKNKILDYLKNGYRGVFSSSGTFFKDIHYLEPGTNLIIDHKLNIKFKRYWKLSNYNPKINILSEATTKLRKLIEREFNKSFRSDTPIAFLLSGGVDSSIISFFSKKIKKKIKFYSFKPKDKNYNESENIDKLKKKLKLNHEYVLPNKSENFKILNNLIQESGYPLMSSTYLAYGSLCKKIENDKFRVLISGNGADEIFSGYYAHHMSYLLSIKNQKNFNQKYLEWEKNTKPFVRMEILKNLQMYKKITMQNNSTFFENKEYSKFFFNKKDLKQKKKIKYSSDIFIDHLNKDLFEDSIPAQMHSIDNISMYHSIEARAPFLSKKLFDFRNNINKDLLINKGVAKFILRKTFKNNIPKKIIENKEKIGFYLPLTETINMNSSKIKNLILNNEITKKYLNKILIKKKITNKNLNHQDEKFLFCLLNIAIFLKKNK